MAEDERTFVYDGPPVRLTALDRVVEPGEEITGPPSLGYIKGMRPTDVSEEAFEQAEGLGIDLVAHPSITTVDDVVAAQKARMEPAKPDATPAAVKKAEELGVDLTLIEGTGKNGRIGVDDVEKAHDNGAHVPGTETQVDAEGEPGGENV